MSYRGEKMSEKEIKELIKTTFARSRIYVYTRYVKGDVCC